jgi:L-ascorbate metabolism protein UlaG (beta-lactamase superfamily)
MSHQTPSLDEQLPGLRVTFLGVSTLLFSDGENAILTDGFFSRPSKVATLFARLTPNRDLITRCLSRAGVTKLNAVIVLHSHFDHALDAPEVVLQQPGARLFGSDSTANIGRGYGDGLREDRIRVIQDGTTETFGHFHITLLRSEHSPLSLLASLGIEHVLFEGEINEPLEQPAHSWAYKEGGSYSLLIKHAGRSILVQASAGFKRGALAGHSADVIFLGIGTLGRLPQSHIDEYWHEVVEAVSPKRIIPIHWDDFSLPLDQPLVPMPPPLDDFDAAMAFLRERASAQNIDVKVLQAWDVIDPFAGLDRRLRL